MPFSTQQWAALHAAAVVPLSQLFAEDADRAERLSVDVAGISFDFAKTHLSREMVAGAEALTDEGGLRNAQELLFTGAIVNPTEGRAAEHLAERGTGSPDAVTLARTCHARMRALVDAVEAGAFGDVTGVLHIGIGGSALGPALLIDALGRRENNYRVEVLSNIDGQAFEAAVANLDPTTTLVVIASKTFSTAETIRNARSALTWMAEAGVSDPYGQLIGITAMPQAAIDFGIDDTRVLPFGESVGGRYSLWSTIGFAAALALGYSAFEELLEGAAEMDRHFRFAKADANAPILAALSDLFYAQRLGCETRAVFSYDERLRLLPPYLQQLVMESNGKSVTAEGQPLGRHSSPVLWGGTGTDVQHAVFQLLHQGTRLVPVEFVTVAEPDDDQDPAHHRDLLLNAFAQGSALMTGRASDDPARHYPGDRPSITILLDRLDPHTLGALLAFYEARTFAEAALLGINPFDQFGVELGKIIAQAIDDPEQRASFDSSTRRLIQKAAL